MGNNICCDPEHVDTRETSKSKSETINEKLIKKSTKKSNKKSKASPIPPSTSPPPTQQPQLSLNSSYSSDQIISNPNDFSADDYRIVRAFEHSVEQKNYKNAMEIIESSPNINFIDLTFKKSGLKPIHIATQHSNSVFLYYLFMKGCDPNLLTSSRQYKETALHIATKNEDIRMMTILLRNHASIDIKNTLGQTPKDIALKTKNEEIIGMFDQDLLTFFDDPENQPELITMQSYRPQFGCKPSIDEYVNSPDSKQDEKNKKFGNNGKINNLDNISDLSEQELSETETESDDDVISNTNKHEHYRMDSNARKILKLTGNKYSIDAFNPKNKDTSSSTATGTSSNSVPKSNKSKSPKINNKVVKIFAQVNKSKKKLPILASWLKKKTRRGGWNDRYLCVVDGHLIWHHDKIMFDPNSKMNFTERKKYRGSLNLLTIKYITTKDGKKSYKLEICGPDKESKKPGASRIYQWKFDNKRLRNDWYEGINKHVNVLKSELVGIDSIPADI